MRKFHIQFLFKCIDNKYRLISSVVDTAKTI